MQWQLKIYDGELVERLRVLLSLGLCITINSDDPSYFGEPCPVRALFHPIHMCNICHRKVGSWTSDAQSLPQRALHSP